MANYKSIEDHIHVQFVPSNHTGYDNPQVTVVIKRDLNEFEIKALKSCLGEALLRWSALTQQPFKAEIKP